MKKEKKNKRRQGEYRLASGEGQVRVLRIFAVAFVIAVTCLCIPTCDDHFFRIWEFASLEDFFLLHPCNWGGYLFAVPHNGRYLGNALGFLLARSYGSAWGLLRILVMAGGPIALYCLIQKLFFQKYPVLTMLLLLLMPVNLYTQAVHWAAGYANYFVPVLGLLVVFCLLRIEKLRAVHYALGMTAAFLTQLFAEHVTVYLAVVLLLCVLGNLYRKRESRLTVCMFAAAAAGAMVMFSNAGYHTVNSDAYRQIGLETVMGTARVLAYDVIIGNGVILLLAGVCFFLLLRREGRVSSLKRILLAGYGFLAAYALLRTVRFSLALESYRRLDLFMAAFALLLLLYFTASTMRVYRKEALFYLGSVCFINGMLLFLSPISARCTFVSFVLLVLYGITLAKEARLSQCAEGKRLCLLFAVMGALYGGYLLFCYAQNYKVQYEWEKYCAAQQEAQAKERYVPALPYPHLVYESNSLIYYIFSIYDKEPGDIYFELWDYGRWVREKDAKNP